MIPLRDTIPSKNIPIINNVLIGANVIFFLIQIMQGSDFNYFVNTYGLVPARYTLTGWGTDVTVFQKGIALFSFMFLHGNLFHLLWNMWFLYIFGDNVEDRLGPARYILFYLLCGIVSGLSHMALNAHSPHPTIGASGAVAGVMGAYFLLHPRSKILTLFIIIIIPWILEIPAFIFLGIWFLMQLINTSASFGVGGNIAWWAHIGGFLGGMVLIKLFGALPATGITNNLRKATARKKSYKFQYARPTHPDEDADMYATIVISPYEALVGARKIITIPYGFQRRTFRVNVPPGIETGKTLRLKGQGKTMANGERGDLMLKVITQ